MVCHCAERAQDMSEFYRIDQIRSTQRGDAFTFNLLARTLLADIMSPLLPAWPISLNITIKRYRKQKIK